MTSNHSHVVNPSSPGTALKRSRLILFPIILCLGALFCCFIYEEGYRFHDVSHAFAQLERREYLNQRNYAVNITSTFKPSFTSPPKQSVIFLVSTKRSGSSFVGELFNKHPNIFYLFEPLQTLTFQVLDGELSNSDWHSKVTEVLDGLVECHFDRGYKTSIEWLTRRSPLCTFNDEVADSILCISNDYFLNESFVSTTLRETCLSRKVITLKLIRIDDLSRLRPYLENPSLDAKIIYLVRDPRGVMNSRNRQNEVNADLMRRHGNTTLEVEDLCESVQQNLKYWYRQPSWLKDRMYVMRYEDIALRPLDMAMEMFQFMGEDFNLDVIKWLFKSTRNIDIPENKPREFQTSRDSAQVVTKWRREMSWLMVSAIQRKCGEAMKMAGYIPLPSSLYAYNHNFRVFTKVIERT